MRDFTLQVYKLPILTLESSIGRSARMDSYMSGKSCSGAVFVWGYAIDLQRERALAMASMPLRWRWA